MIAFNSKKYAVKMISRHLRDFLKEKQGTLSSEDIENLHRMRVAGRRLCNSLWTFHGLLPKKSYKILRRMFSEATKSLGDARDLDTYIAFLAGTREAPELARFKPRIDDLVHAEKKKRLQLQGLVSASLGKLSKELAANPPQKLLIAPGEKELSIKEMHGFARKKIICRLKDLLSFRRFTKSPDEYKKLHVMRIAAKHLRYTLEELDEFYAGKLKPYADKAHHLQDDLGDMHNYHVWGKLVAGSKANGASNVWPEPLKARCAVLYLRSYYSFFRKWKKQKKRGTWKDLKRLLKERSSVGTVG